MTPLRSIFGKTQKTTLLNLLNSSFCSIKFTVFGAKICFFNILLHILISYVDYIFYNLLSQFKRVLFELCILVLFPLNVLPPTRFFLTNLDFLLVYCIYYFIVYFVLVHVSVLPICFPVCYNDKNPNEAIQNRVAASGFGICTDC